MWLRDCHDFSCRVLSFSEDFRRNTVSLEHPWMSSCGQYVIRTATFLYLKQASSWSSDHISYGNQFSLGISAMPPIVRTPPDISDPNATTTKSSVALGRWWDSTGSSPNGTSDLSYTWETTDAELLLNSTTYETPTEIIKSRTSEKPQHECEYNNV